MAHKRLTYLDIPISRRKATASKALASLKESLSNPVLTTEQDATIRARITHLNQWAAGKLEVEETPAGKKPKHHEVVVEEVLDLKEES